LPAHTKEKGQPKKNASEAVFEPYLEEKTFLSTKSLQGHFCRGFPHPGKWAEEPHPLFDPVPLTFAGPYQGKTLTKFNRQFLSHTLKKKLSYL
jgi:hypothetical protein